MAAVVLTEKQFSRLSARELSRHIKIVTPEGRVLKSHNEETSEP